MLFRSSSYRAYSPKGWNDFKARYEEVTADAGYESLDNYLYLDTMGQTCFMKPANHDQKKSKKFKKQIGRAENMTYDSDEDCFTCTQGRRLPLRRECSEWKDGQLVSNSWYRCENCVGCPCRAQCCRARNADRPKEIVFQKTFWEKRAQAAVNISTDRGIPEAGPMCEPSYFCPLWPST